MHNTTTTTNNNNNNNNNCYTDYVTNMFHAIMISMLLMDTNAIHDMTIIIIIILINANALHHY